jgi:hypothetical protein
MTTLCCLAAGLIGRSPPKGADRAAARLRLLSLGLYSCRRISHYMPTAYRIFAITPIALRLPPKGADRPRRGQISHYMPKYGPCPLLCSLDHRQSLWSICPLRGQSQICCRRQQWAEPIPKGADHTAAGGSCIIAAVKDLRYCPEGGRSPPKGADRSVSEDRFAIAPEGGRSPPKGADRSGSDDITLDAAAAPSGIEDRPRRGQIGYADLTRRERQQHRCALSPCPLRGQYHQRWV